MHLLVRSLLLLAACYGAALCQAQTFDSLLLFKKREQMPPLIGIKVNSKTEFKEVSLKEGSFPILLLPAEPVYAAFAQLKALDQLVFALENENQKLGIQDTLNMLTIRKLNDVIEIKDRNIQLGEMTIASLNTSIGGLNNQLDQTHKLVEDCNKMRSAKSIWSILLGSGIGFGVGAILGILVAK